MGLQSALTTALTGLTAAETQVHVIGNNLANANTVAFKASEAEFATQFLQTLSLGGAPTQGDGGTNPRQIGLGTMVAEITPSFNQGTIEISSDPTDLAIQGDGFFIVEGTGSEHLYTRNGVFKMNADNELTTITGNRLLGFGVDDRFQIQTTALQALQIPLGSAAVALATENVYLEGTLTPTGDLADTAEIIETEVLGDAAYTRPPGAPASVNPAVAVGQPLDTTTALGQSGGSLAPGGAYSYKIVFADGPLGSLVDTQGVPSDAISVNLAPAEDQVLLNNIPVDANYATRRIYRTLDGGSTYYFVAEIPDNVTTTFVDGLSDAVVGANPQLNDDTLSGDYTYYVTFADTPGGPGIGTESRPTQFGGPLNVISGRIQIRDLPVDASGQWAVRRIYRNLSSDSSTFYYVGEIADVTTPNLSFTDGASDAQIQSGAEIDFDGPRILASTPLVNVLRRDGSVYETVFQEGTLEFTGRKGGRSLAPKELEITSTTTVDAMGIQVPPGPDGAHPIPSDSSGANPGGSVTTGGRMRLVGNNGVHNAVDIGLSGLQLRSATGQENINMPFHSVQEAVGEGAAADFIVYDSLGVPLNVRLAMVLEDRDSTSTTYRWFADCPDNDPASGVEIAVGTGLVTFDGEGKFTHATEESVSIDRRNIPSTTPLVFDLDFSQLSGLAADESGLAVSRQDGFPPGVLTDFVIGEDGRLRGIFSNGITRDLGQVRLARFSNPAGLEQKGKNLFVTGANSGQPVQGNPGQLGIGEIISGAVELSNTDIGGNLVDLIVASTMYRGNTRVITTAQQMIDELLSLRR
jgi:flagellar hook protein FlgE